MLHLIPPPLHRQALRIAHELRKYWWRFAKPDVTGCRVLAFDDQDRLLLIRHSYGRQSWLPPGGGMSRGEEPLAAAAREFAEELGCPLHAAFILDVVDENLLGARNLVHIVAGTVGGMPIPDGREVIASAFFAANELPHDMPVVLRDRMPEWVKAAIAARHGDAAAAPALLPGQTG
jgi:8-oxo-dGTP pyrophosphatase MutT (NUDIX family)